MTSLRLGAYLLYYFIHIAVIKNKEVNPHILIWEVIPESKFQNSFLMIPVCEKINVYLCVCIKISVRNNGD